MDKFIATYRRELDDDLYISDRYGVAYQADMTVTAEYDAEYWDKLASYEGSEIAERLNEGRRAIVAKHYGDGDVLDVGIGCGEFIKGRPDTYGYDINPQAIDWLVDNNLYRDDIESFGAVTFWDVIEHCPYPSVYLETIKPGGFAFFSIPVFQNLWDIRKSKHYRPGEHLYYWTPPGFIRWLECYDFQFLDVQDFETRAGREGILTFAVQRNV